jgi:hypothetical protein
VEQVKKPYGDEINRTASAARSEKPRLLEAVCSRLRFKHYSLPTNRLMSPRSNATSCFRASAIRGRWGGGGRGFPQPFGGRGASVICTGTGGTKRGATRTPDYFLLSCRWSKLSIFFSCPTHNRAKPACVEAPGRAPRAPGILRYCPKSTQPRHLRRRHECELSSRTFSGQWSIRDQS